MTIMGTDSVSCGSSEISFIMVKSIIKALLSLSTTTALSWPSLVANTSKLFVRSLFTRFFHPCKSLSLFHPPSPPPPPFLLRLLCTLISIPSKGFIPPLFFSFFLSLLPSQCSCQPLSYYREVLQDNVGGGRGEPTPSSTKPSERQTIGDRNE